ncbi:dephospho-CoA kinase [Lutibacter sp.]|uniref:dephospho-CoA kinase n=1 Tax=Lutibacter sp. TaxID=1925666 RepID=UPI0034A042C7
MKIIGLTGGIGSGKTTVLKMFKELGCATYVADIEAKKLMSSNKKLIYQIKQLFGEKAYVDNKLNTAFIAEIVFNDKDKLAALNAFVHPAVREDFRNFVNKSTSKLIIYEAAILFESGSDTLCDFIITVATDIDERIERIIKRDGVTKEQILERMQHQLNDEEKVKKADFVINNSDIFNTKAQVSTIYKILMKL